MFQNKNPESSGLKILIIILLSAAAGIFIYLIALPFYPFLKYNIESKQNAEVDYKNIDAIKKITEEIAGLPASSDKEDLLPSFGETADGGLNNVAGGEGESAANGLISGAQGENKNAGAVKPAVKIANTLIIPKIGVKIPIIESEDENYGLNHGAWKLPKSSAPEESGNMILTGHRFKYLPPSNLTFYLFHKLETGDIASVIWDGKPYYYKIREIKKVPADDISILKQTKTSTLTMYTCDPIYSTKNRLVIIADLVEK